MKVRLKNSLEQGFINLISITGLSMALAFSFLYFISESLISSMSFKYSSYLVGRTGAIMSLPLSDPILIILYGIISLISIGFTVLGFRAFAYGEGLGRTLSRLKPISLIKKSLLLVMTGIFATIPISIGSLLLVLPGLYLAVSFVFFPVLISTESRSLSGLKKSWELTKHNKLRVFGLLLILLIATSVLSLMLVYSGFETTAVLAAGLETVFGIAVISEAFKQLSEGERK